MYSLVVPDHIVFVVCVKLVPEHVIRRAHVSRSRGLPHREGTDGLRRPPF